MSKDIRKIAKLPSIRRLPGYLHFAKVQKKKGRDVISTTRLANEFKLEPIVVRKDLEITKIKGQPGVGYDLSTLIKAIEEFLGWHNSTDVFLVGTGALGTALLGYSGFENHGINIVAAFDADPEKIGKNIHGYEVFDIAKMTDLCDRMKVHLGILCVPNKAAQEVANLMVAGGVKAIWNFSQHNLKVPESVVVQKEVLASGLAVLSVKLSKILAAEEI